ncbi:MAG: hypothetical protein AAFX99_04165 [Myxococcota bacterium]
MFRKEVNEQSPLRILDSSIHGGLGKGNLGVVMARAGVGKTAFLVQIGLDDLLGERKVLHVALGGQTVNRVSSWYDALFDDLSRVTHLEEPHKVRQLMSTHRLIQSYKHAFVQPAEIERALSLYSNHLDFTPDTILIDGFDWTGSLVSTAATLGALKSCAQRLGSELWLTARTHRDMGDLKPCKDYWEIIDVALHLEPKGEYAQVRLLKDHDHEEQPDTTLRLQVDTMRLIDSAHGDGEASQLPPSVFTLLSGGARGSENAFGVCAETWGLQEINFSFEGRPTARERGVIILDADELSLGDVQARYLKEKMRRNYPDTPLFRKVLQSIWHQVNTSSQVFVVGQILPDDTVKGGTGWAAELARHHEKPLFVYDQDRQGWFTWADNAWQAIDPPTITSHRFTGTGSRLLSEHGKQAIQDLFIRSFGEAPTPKAELADA